jgi:hypothetical protein
MKKTLTIVAVLAGAVSGYSQGQIFFYNYATEGGSTLKQAIYNVQPTANDNYSVTYNNYTVSEELGSTSATAETPKGTTVYSGTGLLGTGFTSQLYASSTPNDTLGDLAPVGSTQPFFTGPSTAAGFINGAQTETLLTGSVVTIAIAAWQTTGADGAASSLAVAQADGYAWGFSNLANDVLAVAPATPTPMPTTIESFSLGQSIPEPSTIALGVMGVSALLFRRRK